MKKKLVILIVVGVILILAIGVVYFFWQGGPEIRRLNKNLPEGIRIEKRGDQQVIVNKKDGYEIKVPKEWGGVREVEYLGEEEGQFIVGAKKTDERVVIIVSKIKNEIDLLSWIKNRFQDFQGTRFYSPVIVGEERIGNHNIIKAKDESPVGTFFFYYFEAKSKIYEIYSDYSEKSIRAVILNGNF